MRLEYGMDAELGGIHMMGVYTNKWYKIEHYFRHLQQFLKKDN